MSQVGKVDEINKDLSEEESKVNKKMSPEIPLHAENIIASVHEP